MIEQRWELKLDTGKVVEWNGTSGEDAARRYVDCKGGAVVASRRAPNYGLSVLGSGTIVG